MIHLELKNAPHWMVVNASGSLNDWEDPPNLTEVVHQAKCRDLGAILYDARNVSGEVGAKKAAGNLYVLSQQIENIKTAFVVPDRLMPQFELANRIADSLGAPARHFHSIAEASRWLDGGTECSIG